MIDKVLVIEDDAAIRAIVDICLTRIGGWKITTAASGQLALDIVDDCEPDLILLDVMMAGMDGITVFQHLRERGNTTPVIFLTAKVQEHDIQDYEEIGAAGVLFKPFDPATLPKQIQQILAGKEPLCA